MPVAQPTESEYQRANRKADERKAAALHRYILTRYDLRDVPPYRQTPIVEWAICNRARDKYRGIVQKSGEGLATYYTDALPLDWQWFQIIAPDWVCCPQCGMHYPKDPRYWWWRDKSKGYFWLNACRDCKCKSKKRTYDVKRGVTDRVHVH